MTAQSEARQATVARADSKRFTRELMLSHSTHFAIVKGSKNGKRELPAMHHRHLNHQRYTLAAIDDVISRGRWNDWAELRRAVLADHALLDKVAQICRANASNPYAQRYHFWMQYAQEHGTTT